MDIIGFLVHMFIELLSEIVYDQRRISPHDFPLLLIVPFNLIQILPDNVNNQVSVIPGKLADRIQQHAGQGIHSVIHFQRLSVHGSEHLLVNSIETLDGGGGHLKVFNGAVNRKRVKRNG